MLRNFNEVTNDLKSLDCPTTLQAASLLREIVLATPPEFDEEFASRNLPVMRDLLNMIGRMFGADISWEIQVSPFEDGSSHDHVTYLYRDEEHFIAELKIQRHITGDIHLGVYALGQTIASFAFTGMKEGLVRPNAIHDIEAFQSEMIACICQAICIITEELPILEWETV